MSHDFQPIRSFRNCALNHFKRGALTMDQTISAVGHNLTSRLHVRPPDLENSLKK